MKNNKCVPNASSFSPTTKKRDSDINKSVFKLSCKLKTFDLKPVSQIPLSSVLSGRSNITVKTHIKSSSVSSAIPKPFQNRQRPQQLQRPQPLQRPQVLQRPQPLQHLRPKVRFAQVVLRSQQPAVLSQEDLRQLTSRFEALTATVVRVARSPCPLSVRSLESLLAKEVTECLGPTVNSAKFAEAFVRETRRLLHGLNREFDEGKVKVNPQLVKGVPQPSPKNASPGDPGYKERYLQQLVLNVLLDMCSEAGSKQWLVRGLMRAAVLEPESLQRVEREVQILQRSASRNILRVQQASREVDRLISNHLISKEITLGSEKGDLSKKIPGEDTTNNINERIINEETQPNVKNSGLKYSPPKSSDVSLKTSSKGIEGNHLNVQSLEKKGSTNPYLDPLQSVRPKMDEIVHRELCIAREKTQTLLSQIDDSSLQASHRGSLENMSSDISMIDDDTDNEINAEETLLFLKALKADETHKKVSASMKFSNCPMLESSKRDNVRAPNFQTDGFSCPVSNECEEYTFFGKDERHDALQVEPLEETEIMVTDPEDMRGFRCFGQTYGALREKGVRDVKSVWWNAFDEEEEAREIVYKMKRALDTFHDCPDETFVKNQIIHKSPKSYERSNKDIDVKHYDFTVEEMAEILSNVSKTVYHLPIGGEKRSFTTTFPISYSQQTQLTGILSEIGNALDDSYMSEEYSFQTSGEEEIENKELVKKRKIARTFNMMSENLKRVPSQLRKQPISELKPPDSLMRTLALLASYTYFRDCFICGVMEVRRSKDGLNGIRDAENKSEHVTNLSIKNSSIDLCKILVDDLEIVKPIGYKEESSSKIVSKNSISNGTSVSLEVKQNLALRRVQLMKKSHLEDIHENTSKYEHYIGLSTAVMTVQNISDMFVFLSAVLNNIPDRVKSQKLNSLDPPSSLLSALDILYDAEDGGCFTNIQKTSSLNSLTVQSVSDLFLTLSKTFEDLPERVKRSNILDLNPPQTLLRAVNLLTSLPFNSVLDNRSEEQVWCRSESQDSFYDALEESSCHGHDCLLREDSQT